MFCVISIHSLRMEGDPLPDLAGEILEISIHSLRMEGDPAPFPRDHLQASFQSTPSAWRETSILTQKKKQSLYFNPLPPHGGRLRLYTSWVARWIFQSTPSAWRETANEYLEVLDLAFQSTPSAWRETICSWVSSRQFRISIHSLRMEGDHTGIWLMQCERTISIHSLRMEGDLRFRCNLQVDVVFQSTPSAWRETVNGNSKSAMVFEFQSTPSAWRETND